MIAITASATSDPSPVERNATSVPALRIQMVAILKMAICVSSERKAEPGLFQDCFVCRQNGFIHQRVKRQGWALDDSGNAGGAPVRGHLPADRRQRMGESAGNRNAGTFGKFFHPFTCLRLRK
jgi:hypothetical protein